MTASLGKSKRTGRAVLVDTLQNTRPGMRDRPAAVCGSNSTAASVGLWQHTVGGPEECPCVRHDLRFRWMIRRFDADNAILQV